jgi:hypothetical protein
MASYLTVQSSQTHKKKIGKKEQTKVGTANKITEN